MPKQIIETLENGSVRITNIDNNWIRIPHKWLQNLTDLTPTERYVLIVLKSYQGKTGLICPSLRELATSSGYSLPSIWKIIKRLQQKKVIIIMKEKGKYNKYRILDRTV